jgi:hypothetical protein
MEPLQIKIQIVIPEITAGKLQGASQNLLHEY